MEYRMAHEGEIRVVEGCFPPFFEHQNEAGDTLNLQQP